MFSGTGQTGINEFHFTVGTPLRGFEILAQMLGRAIKTSEEQGGERSLPGEKQYQLEQQLV
ncbi:MAG: hypothetical protein EXR01_02745 [Acetobacteraceae bacterium]|nr:hypothetical protein [Acetobacteraceae bacterium]